MAEIAPALLFAVGTQFASQGAALLLAPDAPKLPELEGTESTILSSNVDTAAASRRDTQIVSSGRVGQPRVRVGQPGTILGSVA